MRRGWYKKWRKNGWLNYRKEPVANRILWERLLEAEVRNKEVRWRKVRGHSKSRGPHKSGNDRADKLAVGAKKVCGIDPGWPSATRCSRKPPESTETTYCSVF
jgi:ribonuclease HI